MMEPRPNVVVLAEGTATFTGDKGLGWPEPESDSGLTFGTSPRILHRRDLPERWPVFAPEQLDSTALVIQFEISGDVRFAVVHQWEHMRRRDLLMFGVAVAIMAAGVLDLALGLLGFASALHWFTDLVVVAGGFGLLGTATLTAADSATIA